MLRIIERSGVAFFQLAEAQKLEGIVAKRKDSRYYFDKRTKDWIKCKALQEEDYVVCGYIPNGSGMSSIVLGQYANGGLRYKGYVTLGVGEEGFRTILEPPRASGPPLPILPGKEDEGGERPGCAAWSGSVKKFSQISLQTLE